MINIANSIQTVNISFIFSTPQRYVDAIKKENITWTVNTKDFMPYSEDAFEYWTGFYTSRPELKKRVKEFSAEYHAEAKYFARRVINQNVPDKEKL